MEISERTVDGVIILDLAGRLVAEDGVQSFLEWMNGLIRLRRKKILINFEKVTYLDSAGVGAVAWKYVTAQKHNGDVKLLNLKSKTHKVLALTKLLTVLESFDSEEAAIDSFVDHDDDETNPIFT
jgi:anti-sigma B factor antagonist